MSPTGQSSTSIRSTDAFSPSSLLPPRSAVSTSPSLRSAVLAYSSPESLSSPSTTSSASTLIPCSNNSEGMWNVDRKVDG